MVFVIGNILYICVCWFFFKNSIASDINECNTGQHECDVNARCLNTDGSYTCLCNGGYDGDGFSCTGK